MGSRSWPPGNGVLPLFPTNQPLPFTFHPGSPISDPFSSFLATASMGSPDVLLDGSSPTFVTHADEGSPSPNSTRRGPQAGLPRGEVPGRWAELHKA